MKALKLSLLLPLFLSSTLLAQDKKSRIDILMKKMEHVYVSAPDSVEIVAKEALPLAVKLGDIEAETKIQRMRGVTTYVKGNHSAALDIYMAAVRRAEKKRPTREFSILFYEIGGLYSKNNDLKSGGEYIKKGLDIALRLKDAYSIADGYNRMGVLYERKQNTDSALVFYRKSLQNNQMARDTLGMSYSLENIAGIYTQRKQPARSIPYLKESMRLRTIIKNKFGLAISHINLAETFLAMNKPDSALKYAGRTIALAEDIKFLDLLKHTHSFLSGIYEKKGNLKLALTHYQKFTAINDSIYNEKKSQQIAELSKKYETEKKEQQIQSLRQRSIIQDLEIRQRNVQLSIAGILFVSVSGVSYLLYNRRKLKEESRLQAEINRHQDQAARAVLNAEEHERRRIATDLHDGLGQLLTVALMNLNTLYDKLRGGNIELPLAEKSVTLVRETYDEMRTISHQMVPNALLKSGLAPAIRDFVSKIDQEKIRVSLDVSGLDSRLNEQTETLIYRTVQEAVNNVIKHSEASKLDIQLVKDEAGISLTIEDNGKGFDQSALAHKNGIGLKNMLDRIALLKGTVDIDSRAGKGTLLQINVPG